MTFGQDDQMTLTSKILGVEFWLMNYCNKEQSTIATKQCTISTFSIQKPEEPNLTLHEIVQGKHRVNIYINFKGIFP